MTKRLNVDRYLIKPVDPAAILDIITEALPTLRKSLQHRNQLPKSFHHQSKILIADDSPENIRLLSARLQSEGYAFVSAKDGEEAL